MSIIFTDGFDEYGSIDNVSKKWDSTATFNAFNVGLESGRLASPDASVLSNKLKFYSNASFTSCTKNFNQVDSFSVGLSINFSSLPAGNGEKFLQIKKDADEVCAIGVSTAGRLQLYSGSSVTSVLEQSNASLISDNTWYYFEFFYDSSNPAGLNSKAFINGNLILTNTGSLLVSGATSISLIGSAIEKSFDDLYLNNSCSFDSPRVIGDARILTFLPTSDVTDVDGTNIETTYGRFGNNSGSSNYSLVDDSIPDTNTYVTSSVSGALDLYQYGFSHIPNNSIIESFSINAYTKKSTADAGAKILSVYTIFPDTSSFDLKENEFNPSAMSTSQIYQTSVIDVSGSVTKSNLNDYHVFGISDAST